MAGTFDARNRWETRYRGGFERFNEPAFAESMTARRSNRANTDTAYIPRVFFFPLHPSIFPNLFKKSSRFDSKLTMYGKGELLLFGRVTKGESVLFLGSIPPRIDRRSGRQVWRIENVNSNRSSWNTVIHRVNAVRKVTQELLLLVVMGACTRDAFRARAKRKKNSHSPSGKIVCPARNAPASACSPVMKVANFFPSDLPPPSPPHYHHHYAT